MCNILYKFVMRLVEWGWTARNAIARQSFARHFWQQINCSTQILTTAQIQLILAKPDSSKWQKKWQLLDSVEQLTLIFFATVKCKSSIFFSISFKCKTLNENTKQKILYSFKLHDPYCFHSTTSGGELLELRLLDTQLLDTQLLNTQLLDTFGSKSIARHKFYQLLKSS